MYSVECIGCDKVGLEDAHDVRFLLSANQASQKDLFNQSSVDIGLPFSRSISTISISMFKNEVINRYIYAMYCTELKKKGTGLHIFSSRPKLA